MTEIARSQPVAKVIRLPKGYKESAADDALLPWLHVEQQLQTAENYWLITSTPEGRPHATPVWGAWVDSSLIMDGHPASRWARNISINPHVTIHLESGTNVVIVEGTVEDVVTNAALAERVIADWNRKYGRLAPDPAGSGIFRFHPRAARAWTKFPDDATAYRWSANELHR